MKRITESEGDRYSLMRMIGYETCEINENEIENINQIAKKIFSEKEYMIMQWFYMDGFSKTTVGELAEIKRERLNWYLRDIVIQLSRQRG